MSRCVYHYYYFIAAGSILPPIVASDPPIKAIILCHDNKHLAALRAINRFCFFWEIWWKGLWRKVIRQSFITWDTTPYLYNNAVAIPKNLYFSSSPLGISSTALLCRVSRYVPVGKVFRLSHSPQGLALWNRRDMLFFSRLFSFSSHEACSFLYELYCVVSIQNPMKYGKLRH